LALSCNGLYCLPNRHLMADPDSTLFLSELLHFVRPLATLWFESIAASYRGYAGAAR
jgi:hypothetical protein